MHFLRPFFYCLKTTLYRVPLRALFFAVLFHGPSASKGLPPFLTA